MNRMAALLALGLLFACGGGGGSAPTPPPPQESAPVIANLWLSPNSAVVGDGGGSISAAMGVDFSDPDGDVTTIRLASGGQTQDTAISGAAGQKSGSIQGTLLLNTGTVGSFTFQVSLLDAKGHVSNALSATYTVSDRPKPPPLLDQVSPSSVVIGGPAFTLTVTGTRFFPDSQVYWNGAPRTTTYLGPDTLSAEIAAQDIAVAGSAPVKVVNPASEGGASNWMTVTIGNLATRIIPERANDVTWDAAHNLLYASIPSTSSKNGNRVLAIDPATGAIAASVFAGSEPGRLAVSRDGQYLYVGLDGANAIKRFILPSLTADLTIPLGSSSFFGAYYALDIQVAPGSPRTVAVSLAIAGLSPSAQGGIAIFDDAVARPVKAPGGVALYTTLQWGADDRAIYAANNQTTGYNYYVLSVDASGVTLVKDLGSAFSSFNYAIQYDPVTNLVYSGSGQILSPASGQLAGSFAAKGTMIPYSSLNSAFYLVWDPLQSSTYKIQKFHLTQFTLQDALSVPMPPNNYGPPKRLVNWGSAGLASCGAGHPIAIHSGPFLAGTLGGAPVPAGPWGLSANFPAGSGSALAPKEGFRLQTFRALR